MLTKEAITAAILGGETTLGIELGSTRIKAVLIAPDHSPIAGGAFDWENHFENGLWTYPLSEVWEGIQAAFSELRQEVLTQYGVSLTKIGAMGVSGMMHGYLAFDENGEQLAEFRTWRNTVTEIEAAELTELFGFNIPQRWSIAHLWRAVKNHEEHVARISHLTTLAGYVHWQLTGQKVLGVGEASGMFPIDSETLTYRADYVKQFDELLQREGAPFALSDILPAVLTAGEAAGVLTEQGARLLDPSGALTAGVPLCPPEGDAGTGMTATNSVAPRTGNVSAGTSIFAMAVLERPLAALHTEIDLVTTPTGAPVAMVHGNTCTSDLDAWVRLFGQAFRAAGQPMEKSELYELLYTQALSASPDCGGITAFNCYAGEPVLGLSDGCPLVMRRPDSEFTLPNFMRALLFSAMSPLQIGMRILLEEEHVALDTLTGHGGLFKTEKVGQQLMASALGVPVAVMETAGEGGPWGMAVLAMFAKNRRENETLEAYLANRVFAAAKTSTAAPAPEAAAGFAQFISRYEAALPIEQAAAKL